MKEGVNIRALRDLYIDYDKELCSLPGMIFDEKRTRSYATGMVLRKDMDWNLIVKEGEAIGFLIIKANENGYDYYVVDTYIKPEYRNQGIMTSHVLKTFEGFRGKTIGLTIIQNNYLGMSFWRSIFKKLGYIPEISFGGGFIELKFQME